MCITEQEHCRCAAGRFDLHHAIKYHGGYREVGQSLGRGSAWPRHTELLDARTLAAELRAFQREQGADDGCMPSARALIDAERQELLQARSRAVHPVSLCSLPASSAGIKAWMVAQRS